MDLARFSWPVRLNLVKIPKSFLLKLLLELDPLAIFQPLTIPENQGILRDLVDNNFAHCKTPFYK